MVWASLCSAIGLIIFFMLHFFQPELWLFWKVGLLVALGFLAAGAGLALARSQALGVAFLLAPVVLIPLVSSAAGRLVRWLDPPRRRTSSRSAASRWTIWSVGPAAC
jgi:hypothetical protein